MRLVKIENNTKIPVYEYFLDYLDCGEFFFLTKFLNQKSSVMIPLTQNTVLEDIQEKYGGYVWYYKFCKTTFRMYTGENGILNLGDIDEVMNWTKIDNYEYFDCRVLKALATGEGLEGFNAKDHIVRWPDKNGGRGEHWYWLLGKGRED